MADTRRSASSSVVADPLRTGVLAIAGRFLALGFLVALAAGPALASAPIRLALQEGAQAVEIGAADLVTVSDAVAGRALFGIPAGRVIRIGIGGPGFEMSWGPTNGERRRIAMPAVRLEARRGPLRVGTRDYPGLLEVWRSGESVVVVVELPFEDYIAGTVRAEMPERWPAEALRAMAVVARTYAAFHQRRNAGKPFHLTASSQHQNYAGRPPDGAPSWEAVRVTTGQVLTWQGQLFQSFYHSDSGGFTEPPQAVFSGEGALPLPGVRDEFSLDSPHYTWTITLRLGAITERLRQAALDVGEVIALSVVERTPSFRVARIAVEHSRGTTTLKGTDFRRAVGYDVVKSTLFVPVPSGDGSIRFEGRGWGHGVGMSQFGARGMAERGYAYAQILQHYYPGTTLGSLR